MFDERFGDYKGSTVSSGFINVDLVQRCAEDLSGKAAGLDGLMAEHIHFAHPVLIVHLACLFSMMYKFSLVPDDFGRGIVIPFFYLRMLMVTSSQQTTIGFHLKPCDQQTV